MTIEILLLTNDLTAAANDLESAATELEQKNRVAKQVVFNLRARGQSVRAAIALAKED